MSTFTNLSKNTAVLTATEKHGLSGATIGSPIGLLLVLTYAVGGIVWTNVSHASDSVLTFFNKASSSFTADTKNVFLLWGNITLPWQLTTPWQMDTTGAIFTFTNKN